MITVTVNGKQETLAGETTVSEFLEARGIRTETVAVEVNGELIDRSDFPKTVLTDGASVELVFHMAGGGNPHEVLALIGDTPVVELKRIAPANAARVFCKLERYNPCGSVKDRIAAAMILDAEEKGIISPGAGVIVEPTSGNTGIGLAMVCAARGYKCITTMPESMSDERVGTLQWLGAEVVLTPAEEGMQGAIDEALRIVEAEKNAYMPQQFENPANPRIHRSTTAREILRQVEGPVDAFVAGVGTGGTITGVGEVLKKEYPEVQIVAVEPASSAVLSGGAPGPHRIQGIGAGFVPAVLNRRIIDRIVAVEDHEAYETARELGRVEGIFCGISSGAAVFAALQVAEELGAGKKVVTILPDGGEKYVSMIPYFRY